MDISTPGAWKTRGGYMLNNPGMGFSRDNRKLWSRMRGPFVGSIWQHDGWVRLFGWGLQWKSSLVRPVLFSERNGLVRWVHVGPWRLRWLRKQP